MKGHQRRLRDAKAYLEGKTGKARSIQWTRHTESKGVNFSSGSRF
jgi:hypothetical protein